MSLEHEFNEAMYINMYRATGPLLGSLHGYKTRQSFIYLFIYFVSL